MVDTGQVKDEQYERRNEGGHGNELNPAAAVPTPPGPNYGTDERDNV